MLPAGLAAKNGQMQRAACGQSMDHRISSLGRSLENVVTSISVVVKDEVLLDGDFQKSRIRVVLSPPSKHVQP